MMLDPEEIFADLINFRKEINAPDVHMNYTVKPFRFVIFSPASKKFHFMPCHRIVIQKLKPCIDCLSEWDNGRGWKSYSEASDDEKKIIRDKFSIHEFFEHCNRQE